MLTFPDGSALTHDVDYQNVEDLVDPLLRGPFGRALGLQESGFSARRCHEDFRRRWRPDWGPNTPAETLKPRRRSRPASEPTDEPTDEPG